MCACAVVRVRVHDYLSLMGQAKRPPPMMNLAAGFSYDWDRELSTTDPEYYKWTQWIFVQLFKRGLAYQAEVPVNWCPALGTVLSNEEVIDGKSERGDHPVVRQPMKQVPPRLAKTVSQPLLHL